MNLPGAAPSMGLLFCLGMNDFAVNHLTLNKEAENGIQLVPSGIIVPFLRAKSKIKM